jgi:cytochrome c peroxidase
MHDARFDSLEQVIAHYRTPPGKSSSLHELEPLVVTDHEAQQLIAFLKTLSGEPVAPARPIGSSPGN